MRLEELETEWKATEVLFERYLDDNQSELFKTKAWSMFYARWICRARVPLFLLKGLKNAYTVTIPRFLRDTENNDEFFVLAVDILLRKYGYQGIPSNTKLLDLSTILGNHAAVVMKLTDASGELNEEQLEHLAKIADALSGVSRHN